MGKGGKGPPPHVRAFRSHARGGGMFTDGTVDLDGLHRLLNDPAVNGSGPGRGVDLDQCAGGVDGFASVIGSRGSGRRSPLDGTPVSRETAAVLLQAFDDNGNGVVELAEFEAIFDLMKVTADGWEFAMTERRKRFAEVLRRHAPRLGLSPHEPLPRASPFSDGGPLAAYYGAEPVVATVETDARARAARACATAPLKAFFIPFPLVCFWPHGVILGGPCAFAAKPCWVHRAARATTVELRESTLRVTTRPYAGWAPLFGFPCCALPSMLMGWCGEGPIGCGDANGVAEEQRDVIPLEFVESAALDDHAPGSVYTCDAPTPSVVVRAFGGRVVAAVDGAKNGEAFAAAVEQRKGARARRPLDDGARAAYAHHLAGSWLRLDALRHGGVLDVGGSGGGGGAAAMMQPPAAAAPAASTIQVQVPPNAGPGATIAVQAPDGRQIHVQVPAQAGPGAVFQVQIPPAAPVVVQGSVVSMEMARR